MLIVLLGLLALPARAHGDPSIFDDDWKPAPAKPKPSVPAALPPDQPATSAPRLPPRAAPPPAVAKPPAGTTAPVQFPARERAAVPGAAAITKAEKLVKEAFQDEYARTTPADRIEFARTLLSEAQQSVDDLPTQYVLLCEARDMASAGGEAELAVEAARALRDNFQIDARAARGMEQSALTAAIHVMCGGPSPVITYETARRASNLGMEMAERDFAAGDYAGAAQIAATAELAARQTQGWEYPAAHGRVEWLQAIAAEFEADRTAIATFKSNPSDPAGNLAAGRLNFVYLDQPEAGLPLLAKGSDPMLKLLAQKDLAAHAAGSSSPSGSIAAADGWAEAARSQPSPMKDAMQRRAVSLYGEAALNVKGLEQLAVRMREQSIRESRARHGLTAEFFRGEQFAYRVFARTDSFINYDWNEVAPDISIARQRFSARWSGWIKATPGDYQLIAIHDDGVRIWIDGQVVIDHWSNDLRKDIAPVQFTGELQTLRIDFHQHEGGALMALGWIAPGSDKAAMVPPAAFYHEPIALGPAVEPYARMGTDGVIHLAAIAATAHGPEIGYADGEQSRPDHIGAWNHPTDWVSWDLDAADGDYFVDVNYACDGGNAGSNYTLSVGTNRLNGQVSDTGGWKNCKMTRLGRVHLGPGLQSIRIKAVSKAHDVVMDLHEVALTPAKSVR
jgi:hypothetical protein